MNMEVIMKKILVTIIALLFTLSAGVAVATDSGLTEKEKEKIAKEVYEKTDESHAEKAKTGIITESEGMMKGQEMIEEEQAEETDTEEEDTQK
jgi:uncharacterized protein YxeA